MCRITTHFITCVMDGFILIVDKTIERDEKQQYDYNDYS